MLDFNPSICTILVKGLPGTGKTSLALELLRKNGGGTYVSTRSSKEKLALQNPEVKMVVVGNVEKEFSVGGATINAQDYRLATPSSIVRLVLQNISAHPGKMIVLDSWDAFGKEMDPTERLKTEKTMVAAAESTSTQVCFVSEELGVSTMDFLVDAVVELKSEIHQGSIRRTMEIKKLRGQKIVQPVQVFSLKGGVFSVAPETQILLTGEYKVRKYVGTPNSPSRYASGQADLDNVLGGGFRKGSVNSLEFGSEISEMWLQPSFIVVIANFLWNGGTAVFVPDSVPPHAILDPLRAMLPIETVNRSVRLGYYGAHNDPCVFKLDTESAQNSFKIIRQEISKVKTEKNTPCHIWLGVGKMELVNGVKELLKQLSIFVTETKNGSDYLTLSSEHTTSCKEVVASMADTHLIFEVIGRTLTSHGLKPLMPIMTIKYEYSRGFPHLEMSEIS